MSSIATRTALFGRDSRVHAYWLARSEGFELAHGRLGRGRVEAVVREPGAATADALVVRGRLLRRRRVLSADEVVAVDPAARLLLVERRPRRSVPVRATARSARRAAHAATVPRVRAAALAAARAWEWTRPRAITAARAAVVSSRAGLARAGLWLRPRAATAFRTADARARAGAARASRATAETIARLGPRVAAALSTTNARIRALVARASRATAAAVARLRPRVAGGLRAADPRSRRD